jgi:hypothetical protein
MNYNTEFKLQEFREEQSQLFDENGKRYSNTPISERTAELMLQIIDELANGDDTAHEKCTLPVVMGCYTQDNVIEILENATDLQDAITIVKEGFDGDSYP